MDWDNSVVTNAGITLLNQWLKGGELIITSVAAGTGTVAPAALMAQTSLTDQRQILPLVGVVDSDNGRSVQTLITSVNLESGYTLNQVGLWAKLSNGDPVFFAIMQDAGGLPVPSKYEVPEFAIDFFATIPFSNQPNLTVVVDTSSLVTYGTMQEAITEAVKDKAKKPGEYKEGNLQVFDKDGNPADSKKSISDIEFNIKGLPALTDAELTDADSIPIYDESAKAHKRTLLSSILAWVRTKLLGSTSGILKADGKGVISAALEGMDYETAGKAKTVQDNLDTHKNSSNPHKITYTDVGAEKAGSAKTVQDDLNTHKNSSNPHSGTEPKIVTGTVSQYIRGNKTLSSFATDVLGVTLTGVLPGSSTTIAETDTLLAAMGKLQAQVNTKVPYIVELPGKVNVNTVLTSGFYLLPQDGGTHGPDFITSWGTLLVINFGAVTTQMLSSYVENRTAFRTGSALESTPWREIATASSNNSIQIGTSVQIGSQSKTNGYESCVAIGNTAQVAGDYATAIGYRATVEGGNYNSALGAESSISGVEKYVMQLGNNWQLSALRCRVALTVSSDDRDKMHVKDIDRGLDFINRIRPIQYVLNHRAKYVDDTTTADIEEAEENIGILDVVDNTFTYAEVKSKLRSRIKLSKEAETAKQLEQLERLERESPLDDLTIVEIKAKRKDLDTRSKYGLGEYDREAHAAGTKAGERRRVGVSAQQVQQLLTDIYGTDNYADVVLDNLFDARKSGDVPDGVESQLGVNYTALVPFLIQAVQTLSKKIEMLEQVIRGG